MSLIPTCVGVAAPVADSRPQLSIITCANRSNPYFAEAIASLAQACAGHPVQRVLVANGGWQPTESIAAGFDLVVTTADRGLGLARNLGARHSAGEWMTFFDSDDLLDPTYVAETLAAIEAPQARDGMPFFFNATSMISEQGETMQDWRPALGRIPDALALRLAHPYTGATLVVRTALFQEMGGYCWSGYAEDYELTLRLFFGPAGRHSPHRHAGAIYRYRQHGDTMSGSLRGKIRGVRAVQWHYLRHHGRLSMLLGVLASTLRLARVPDHDH